jgi:protein SCO1/2
MPPIQKNKAGGIMFRSVMFSLVLILSWTARASSPVGSQGHHQHDHSHHEELAAKAPLSDSSIYNLTSNWTNQDGKVVKLSELAGRPRLVTMVYTSCTSACPMLIGEVKNVLSGLTPAEKNQISPLIFTFDPERDTPEALKKFATKMKVEGGSWTFLTGSAADVSEIAGVLGVQYKKLDSGDYIHSNAIFFFNEKGEIVSKKDGLKTPAEAFIAEIKKNLKKAAK